MNDIIKKGFQQRIGDLEYIGQKALEALAIIAMSYKHAIDRNDKSPDLYAQDMLDSLGVDLEILVPHLEQAMQHLGWPKEKNDTNHSSG